jgi:hypothetical protein
MRCWTCVLAHTTDAISTDKNDGHVWKWDLGGDVR